ncbi:MAG: chromosome segregation protein SMC [Thermodesulfobacteriota bacterium]
MRIKNIYIQGFKSFMDKLHIQISPGINTFVGPNGCGKSNIVDAIRWVMGEQSPKKLRGRQMEDMIFSGADSSKPFGMAEVTLTFENGAGAHDAEEIAITRRLFRSGESEYLINKTPCRLKDINDLFMDTGLGNKTYSIIAQGEISTIIEQKPEETRLLLEEAAGISKYKARREASLRKITLTKENLTRVEDLLSEIKREMNSLKRQAGKARRYKEVSAEIRRLNLALNAHSYDELQSERERKEKTIEEIIRKARGLESRFSESEQIIGVKNTELAGKGKELSDLKESVYSLREEARKQQTALQYCFEDQQRFREADTTLGREKAEFTEKVKGFQSDIDKINFRLAELEESLQELSLLHADREAGLQEETEELEGKREMVEEQRIRHIELTTKEAGLEAEIRNLSAMINQSQMRRSDLERESMRNVQKLEQVSEALEEKKAKQNDLSFRISSIAESIQEQETARDHLAEERKKKESERSQAESELRFLGTQVKTIRGIIENYEGYSSGVRTIMKAYGPRVGNGDKVLGVLADFIKVEPEFEVAVEAVLNERLQYVVVAGQRDGKEAVEYLRSKDVGRSYFVPLEEFSGPRFKETEKFGHNGFPLLRDHISVPDRFKPIIQSFMGNAALVSSLSEAITEWNNGRANQTLVTSEGDLVDERGVILGGKVGKDTMGLLKRRREERELAKTMEEKQKLIASLQTEIDDLSREERRLNGLLEHLHSEHEVYAKETEELERQRFLLESESEQHMQRRQYVAEQLEALSGEGEGRQARLEELEGMLGQCREEKENLESFVSESEAVLKELDRRVNGLKEDLSNIGLRYNRDQEEQKGLIKEKERLEQFLGEIAGRINKAEQGIQSNREQYQNSLLLEKDLKEALTAAQQRERELDNTVSERERELERIRQELRDKEKETASLREQISAIRDEINEHKIGEAEIDFQIKGLVSQVGRETGISLESEYRRYLEEEFSRPVYEAKLNENVRIKDRLGEVNLLAINDYEKLKERYEYIKAQEQDLLYAIDSLDIAIKKINKVSKQKFLSTLKTVDAKLNEVFPVLFGGGKARLRLIDENLPLESGVLVEVQPPGKTLAHMGLLSGGEKALAAMALLFAIYLVKPSPFIIMDEVDAPLDAANTDRFNDLLKGIQKASQVVMVTHNRKTMEQADRLYGVTMDTKSISKIVSVNLEQYHEPSS